MRKVLMAATAIFALGAAGVAGAAESSNGRPAGSGLVSSDSIRKDLEDMGYRVVRIRPDDGTYKVRATDTETGTPLKLRYDVATGNLIQAKPGH